MDLMDEHRIAYEALPDRSRAGELEQLAHKLLLQSIRELTNNEGRLT
jgi:hypothetical protein